MPGWDDAYSKLIHDKYGGVCINAAIRTGLAGGQLAEAEDVFGHAFDLLRRDGRPRGPWNALKSWNGVDPFGPWLRVVVTRLCVRLAKKRGDIALTDLMNASTSRDTDAYADLVDDVFGGVWDEESNPERVTLMDCLRRLYTENHRGYQILARYYVDRLTDTQIAEIEGITRAHANRLKQAAVRDLRGCVNGERHD